jgi:RecA-family ATPase
MTARDDNDRMNDGEQLDPKDGQEVRAPNVFLGVAVRAQVDWFTKRPPRRRYLVTREGTGSEEGNHAVGFLPRGKVGILAAAGGAGKTMALVQLALSVATGEQWLGEYDVPPSERGHVLLALGEEDAEEVHRRLHYAFRAIWPEDTPGNAQARDEAARLAHERITVLPLAGQPVGFVATDRATREVSTTLAHEQLVRLLTDAGHEWSLVVLDPLSRFAGADTESDAAAATRFIQAVEALVDVPGRPTVLLAAHTTKNSRKGDDNPNDATAVRGSSALTDGARWAMTMMPERQDTLKLGPFVWLELVKSNYGPPDKPRKVARADGGALRPLTSQERAAHAEALAKAEAAAQARHAKAEAVSQGDAAPARPATLPGRILRTPPAPKPSKPRKPRGPNKPKENKT